MGVQFPARFPAGHNDVDHLIDMTTRNPEIKFTQLFIDGQFVDSVSGKTFASVNPSTGKTLCHVAEGDKADIDKAVAAAKRAFKLGSEWRTMDASKRGHLISKLADLIERDADYLASLEALDNGKPLSEALFDIECAVGCLRYYSGWADKIHGQQIPADGNVFVVTRKEPVGVVGQIIPWNYPLVMLSWKWGPALAAGCTIILKPAEQTPLSALYVAHLTLEAGFPTGVINVVNGFGEIAGAALTAHNDVDKIAFTGSTQVGKIIMETSAKTNMKRVSLELGGKSPIVVFPDVDLDEAVTICYNAIFPNMGQCCCAGSRTFVHEKIYDEFVKKATEMAAASRLAILFADVTDDMRIAKEEIFGPVQSILKFSTMEEVIERANSTNYGLGSGVLSKNIDTALTFAQAIQAGSVWVNCYD